MGDRNHLIKYPSILGDN